MPSSSLYERLGGEEKIREIAADVFDNHLKNNAVKARSIVNAILGRSRPMTGVGIKRPVDDALQEAAMETNPAIRNSRYG